VWIDWVPPFLTDPSTSPSSFISRSALFTFFRVPGYSVTVLAFITMAAADVFEVQVFEGLHCSNAKLQTQRPRPNPHPVRSRATRTSTLAIDPSRRCERGRSKRAAGRDLEPTTTTVCPSHSALTLASSDASLSTSSRPYADQELAPIAVTADGAPPAPTNDEDGSSPGVDRLKKGWVLVYEGPSIDLFEGIEKQVRVFLI
jgi:hypothetical protein